jgi:hypothetical protein
MASMDNVMVPRPNRETSATTAGGLILVMLPSWPIRAAENGIAEAEAQKSFFS